MKKFLVNVLVVLLTITTCTTGYFGYKYIKTQTNITNTNKPNTDEEKPGNSNTENPGNSGTETPNPGDTENPGTEKLGTGDTENPGPGDIENPGQNQQFSNLINKSLKGTDEYNSPFYCKILEDKVVIIEGNRAKDYTYTKNEESYILNPITSPNDEYTCYSYELKYDGETIIANNLSNNRYQAIELNITEDYQIEPGLYKTKLEYTIDAGMYSFCKIRLEDLPSNDFYMYITDEGKVVASYMNEWSSSNSSLVIIGDMVVLTCYDINQNIEYQQLFQVEKASEHESILDYILPGYDTTDFLYCKMNSEDKIVIKCESNVTIENDLYYELKNYLTLDYSLIQIELDKTIYLKLATDGSVIFAQGLEQVHGKWYGLGHGILVELENGSIFAISSHNFQNNILDKRLDTSVVFTSNKIIFIGWTEEALEFIKSSYDM